MNKKNLHDISHYPFPQEVSDNADLIRGIISNIGDRRLYVTFCGMFKAGKSSLINTILGIQLLPTRAIHATGIVTKVYYSSKPVAYCITKGYHQDCDKKIEIQFDEIASYILLQKNESFGESHKERTEVSIGIPHSLLKYGLVLVDTPGLGDKDELTQITMEEVLKSDLVVMTFNASQFLGSHERVFYHYVNKILKGFVVPVVNRSDQVDKEHDMQEIIRSASKHFSMMGNTILGSPLIYYTSARMNSPFLDGFKEWLTKYAGCRWYHRLLRSRILAKSHKAPRLSIIVAKLIEISTSLQDIIKQKTNELNEIDSSSKKVIKEKKRLFDASVKQIKLKLMEYPSICNKQVLEMLDNTLPERLESIKTIDDWVTKYQYNSGCEVYTFVTNIFDRLNQHIQSLIETLPIVIQKCEVWTMYIENFPAATPPPMGVFERISDWLNDIDRKNIAKKECVPKTIAYVREHIAPRIYSEVEAVIQQTCKDLSLYHKTKIHTSGLEKKIESLLVTIQQLNNCQLFVQKEIKEINNEIHKMLGVSHEIDIN